MFNKRLISSHVSNTKPFRRKAFGIFPFGAKKNRNINFLKENELPPEKTLGQPPQKTGSNIKKPLLYCAIFLIMMVMGFSTKIIISGTEALKNFGGKSILTQIKNLLIRREIVLSGEHENRINMLLLGIGGSGHEGPELTDTIILASFEPKTKHVTFLSIPRDLYIETTRMPGIKINALYAQGNQNKKKGGGQLVKETVSEFLDTPIHYYARINFEGFRNFIDVLGGIEVDVERSFVDTQFPVPRFTTRTLKFEKGLQHFDGATALQFARSRHGNNGEGSDFARSRRQQKMIFSIKEKLFSSNILLKPHKIETLARILGENLETDLELGEVLHLAKLAHRVDHQNIALYVLDDSNEGHLRSAIGYDGAFLLIPKDIALLRTFVRQIAVLDAVRGESPKIVVQNGTKTTGKATETTRLLEKNGFTVIKTENALKQSYIKTVIFDLSHGGKNASLLYLQSQLHANISTDVPVDLWKEYQDTDFVIILGENDA